MPIDPKTGEKLPYAGEPGYEESAAANPEAYMDDTEGRLAAVSDLMGAAEEDPFAALDPEEGVTDEEAGEVFQPDPEIVSQVFMQIHDRVPDPDQDAMEIQLIESVVTSDMQEDLMRQDITLNDIVLEVHRAREFTTDEEAAPMMAPPEAAPAAPLFGA